MSLTNVAPKGKEGKGQLIEEVRNCVDEYKYVYVFEPHNMRSNFLKDIRNQLSSTKYVVIFSQKMKTYFIA